MSQTGAGAQRAVAALICDASSAISSLSLRRRVSFGCSAANTCSHRWRTERPATHPARSRPQVGWFPRKHVPSPGSGVDIDYEQLVSDEAVALPSICAAVAMSSSTGSSAKPRHVFEQLGESERRIERIGCRLVLRQRRLPRRLEYATHHRLPCRRSWVRVPSAASLRPRRSIAHQVVTPSSSRSAFRYAVTRSAPARCANRSCPALSSAAAASSRIG
jgi:hypothetical protein